MMSEERFVSPCQPPEGHVRELLDVLIEECSEVIKRCTKALRFGLPEVQPEQSFDNAQRIGHEVGDILETVDRLVAAGVLDADDIDIGKRHKKRQLDKFLQQQPFPSPAIDKAVEALRVCPTCDGNGTIDEPVGHLFKQCPDCEGTGVAKPEDESR